MPDINQKDTAPFHSAELRIHACISSLKNLPNTRINSNNHIGNKSVQEIIEAINHYYARSWENAKTSKTKDIIADSFELFVTALRNLSTLDPNRINNYYEQFVQEINNLQNRIIRDVIGYNVYNTFRIAFWASTAVTLAASVFILVAPMILVPTIFGIATAVTVAGLLFHAVSQMVDSFTRYRSTSRHQENKNNQNLLLNLFNPAQNNNNDSLDSYLVSEYPENVTVI